MLKKKKKCSSKFTVNSRKEKGYYFFFKYGGYIFRFIYLSEVDKQNINNEEK